MSFLSHPPRGCAGLAASAPGDMGAVSETEAALAAATASGSMAIGRSAVVAFVGGLVWLVKIGFWLGKLGKVTWEATCSAAAACGERRMARPGNYMGAGGPAEKGFVASWPLEFPFSGDTVLDFALSTRQQRCNERLLCKLAMYRRFLYRACKVVKV